jgi:hypothetical protein
VDLNKRLRKVVEGRRGEAEASKLKYQQVSQRKLLTSLRKKCQTIFIGDIARIEKYFGFLWGQGKKELTPEERKWRTYWEKCRTEILDNGNTQLRAVENEINEHTIERNRYETKIL